MKNFNTFFKGPIIKAITLFCFLAPNVSYAKPLSKLKKKLHPIHLNFSIGYNLNYYRLMGINMILFEKDGQYYLYDKKAPTHTAYLFRSWGMPFVRVQLHEGNTFLTNLVTNSKNKTFDYNGMGNGIPITLSGHIDILKKFRVELGSMFSIQFIKKLTPVEDSKDTFPDYIDSVGRYYILKFFLSPGFKLFENYAYTLLINAQVAYPFIYGDFINDPSASMIGGLTPPIGIGATLEKHISGYLSVFAKFLYEHTSPLITSLPKSDKSFILPTMNSIYLQFGVSVNPAELPKCPIPNCKIKIKHKHTDTSYRGSAWTKGRTPQGARLYDK